MIVISSILGFNPMTDPNGAAIYGDMDPINIPPLC